MNTKTYQVFDIEGYLHPTGHIDILSRLPHANSPQCITFYSGSFPRETRIHAYHTPETSVPVQPNQSLYNVEWLDEDKNVKYYGELGGDNTIQVPPIPICLLSDVQEYEFKSIVHTWDIHGQPNPIPLNEIKGRIKLLHKNTPWGTHQNTMRFSLTEENPDPYPWLAYNYVHSFSPYGLITPLVDFWFGVVSGNTVKGHQYYLVS